MPALENPNHERFCLEYVKDRNATQAAVRAGYSSNAARQQGSRLLTNVAIKARVDELLGRIADRLEISAANVLGELAKLGFANMDDYVRVVEGGDAVVDLSNMDRDKWAAVQEITVDSYTEGGGEDAREVKRVKFKLSDKRAALVDLGKHLGLFVTKHELSGPGGGPLEVVELTETERAAKATALIQTALKRAEVSKAKTTGKGKKR
jgi:phage terminase small subunit